MPSCAKAFSVHAFYTISYVKGLRTTLYHIYCTVQYVFVFFSTKWACRLFLPNILPEVWREGGRNLIRESGKVRGREKQQPIPIHKEECQTK
jgi:hypothetical protein